MQSVKIITTPSTTSLLSSGIVGGSISSPTTITSTTESTAGQQNVSSDHLTSSTNSHNHHHHNHHNNRNSSICHHGKGMDHPCGGSVNNICTNVSSSIPAIGICATIAFMDIKSASKAHLAEHKLDDRILTTEYYEPSTMQLHNSNVTAGEGGCNLVVNSKTSESNNVIVAGDMKQETHSIAHGRFTSTSSSHGLVLKHTHKHNSKKNKSQRSQPLVVIITFK